MCNTTVFKIMYEGVVSEFFLLTCLRHLSSTLLGKSRDFQEGLYYKVALFPFLHMWVHNVLLCTPRNHVFSLSFFAIEMTNEGQFAFNVDSCVMSQHLRGTLTYILKVKMITNYLL